MFAYKNFLSIFYFCCISYDWLCEIGCGKYGIGQLNQLIFRDLFLSRFCDGLQVDYLNSRLGNDILLLRVFYFLGLSSGQIAGIIGIRFEGL